MAQIQVLDSGRDIINPFPKESQKISQQSSVTEDNSSANDPLDWSDDIKKVSSTISIRTDSITSGTKSENNSSTMSKSTNASVKKKQRFHNRAILMLSKFICLGCNNYKNNSNILRVTKIAAFFSTGVFIPVVGTILGLTVFLIGIPYIPYCYWVTSAILFVNSIFFLCHYNLKVFVLSFTLIFYFGLMFFSYAGIHNDVAMTMLLLVPTLNIFVGQAMSIQVITMTIYFIGIFIILVYNLIMGVDRVPLESPMVIRFMVVNQWANLFTGNSIVMLFLFLIMKTMKENTNLIERVARCILKLDLDNEFINKIMKKSQRNSSKNLQVLKRIIKNVRSYKMYLPASLYTNENDTQESLESNLSEGELKRIKSSNSDIVDDCVKANGSNNGLVNNVLNVMMFQRRNVSSMIIDINGYHKMISIVRNVKLIEKFTSQYLEYMENCVLKNHGVIHSIDGDKIICTWNSMKKSLNPELDACFAANECSEFNLTSKTCLKNVIERGKGSGIINEDSIAFLESMNFSVAVVTDFLICGNIGSKKTKRFVQTGFGMSLLYSIIKLCKKFDSKVIIDENTNRAIGVYHFRTIPLVDVIHGNFCIKKNPTIRVYHLGQKKIKNENQEWLYAISKSDLSGCEAESEAEESIKSKDKVINAFWEYYNRREYKKCVIELEIIKKRKLLNDKQIKYLDEVISGNTQKAIQLKNPLHLTHVH